MARNINVIQRWLVKFPLLCQPKFIFDVKAFFSLLSILAFLHCGSRLIKPLSFYLLIFVLGPVSHALTHKKAWDIWMSNKMSTTQIFICQRFCAGFVAWRCRYLHQWSRFNLRLQLDFIFIAGALYKQWKCLAAYFKVDMNLNYSHKVSETEPFE